MFHTVSLSRRGGGLGRIYAQNSGPGLLACGLTLLHHGYFASNLFIHAEQRVTRCLYFEYDLFIPGLDLGTVADQRDALGKAQQRGGSSRGQGLVLFDRANDLAPLATLDRRATQVDGEIGLGDFELDERGRDAHAAETTE